jgi:hypothetical protein
MMDTTDIFEETYDDAEDSSESESGEEVFNLEQLEISNDEEKVASKLGISEAQAKENYNVAGSEVNEEADRITVADNANLMDAKVNDILDDIVNEIQMPYKPAEFQRVAINALGGMKNVVLISPTGQCCI